MASTTTPEKGNLLQVCQKGHGVHFVAIATNKMELLLLNNTNVISTLVSIIAIAMPILLLIVNNAVFQLVFVIINEASGGHQIIMKNISIL